MTRPATSRSKSVITTVVDSMDIAAVPAGAVTRRPARESPSLAKQLRANAAVEILDPPVVVLVDVAALGVEVDAFLVLDAVRPGVVGHVDHGDVGPQLEP